MLYVNFDLIIRYAILSDLEKSFLQISLAEKHRDAQDLFGLKM